MQSVQMTPPVLVNTPAPKPLGLPSQSSRKTEEWIARLRQFFDDYAPQREKWRKKNIGYHKELERGYRYHVPEGASILEIGCGTGDLLAALKPARGVGIDLSPEMIRVARANYPNLEFKEGAFEQLARDGQQFDYIILSDLLVYVFDILALFQAIKPYCHARTRIIINTHSRVWQPILFAAEKLGLRHRQPALNWVTAEDITNLLHLAGFETIQTESRILLPKRVPGLTRFFNSVLAPFAPFRWFCLTNWIVARVPTPVVSPSVSVICPCRNEAGNIPEIVAQLPKLGTKTELIFVEGNSSDDTFQACLDAQAAHPELQISVLKQSGKGKKDAVWLGFEKAQGDILMILDADLSVPPHYLEQFYDALASGRAEMANGSRLVYSMDKRAMRFLNLLGNRFFSLAFSWLIGQHVKDTLCGTKVMLRSDFERLKAGGAYFGNFDPFGDFDLLFGSAKLGLRIVDIPIRYRERTYGETQISRFRHGWMLLKMCGVGLLRLKMR